MKALVINQENGLQLQENHFGFSLNEGEKAYDLATHRERCVKVLVKAEGVFFKKER